MRIPKYYLIVFLLICLIPVLAAGCSGGGTSGAVTPGNNASNVSEDQQGDPNFDIDLSVSSGVMLSVQVNNLMATPDDSIGKTIKMAGPYMDEKDESTGMVYHFVIVEGADACCISGVEFIWEGEHAYPDEYPEVNERIVVSGVFDKYDENDRTYYYILVNELLRL